jgi:ketosteroid isomerase-like protein
MTRSLSRSTRIVLALATLALLSAPRAWAGAEQEIDQIEDARYDAMIAGDLAKFASILADEFIYNQPTGKVADKAAYLEQLKSGEVKIKKAERHGVTIHVYGDVATATGSTRVDLELKGESRQVDLRYLNVWVKRDDRWQLASRQSAFKPK